MPQKLKSEQIWGFFQHYTGAVFILERYLLPPSASLRTESSSSERILEYVRPNCWFEFCASMEDTASNGSEYLRDHKIGAVEYMALEVREFSDVFF